MLHLHRKGFQGNVKNKRFIKIALFKIKNRTSSSTKSASADMHSEDRGNTLCFWLLVHGATSQQRSVAQRDIYVGG